VEEVEQLLLKLRKFSLANESKMDDSSAADSREKGDRDRSDRDRDRDRDRGDGERKRSSEGNGGGTGGARQGIAASGRGRGRDEEDRREVAPRPVVDPLPPAYMNNLDDYLEMLYQVSGKSDKEREEGLKLQVHVFSSMICLCAFFCGEISLSCFTAIFYFSVHSCSHQPLFITSHHPSCIIV